MRKLLVMALWVCLGAAAMPLWAQGDQAEPQPEAKAADKQPAGDTDRPARENARRAERERARERAAAQSNGNEHNKLRQFAAAVLGGFGIVLVALAFITVRAGFSLGCGAVFPGFTARGREWVTRRPWLCWTWGVAMGIAAFIGVGILSNLGPPGAFLAVVLSLATIAAVAIGGSGLCEAVGQRLYALTAREGSRLAHLGWGSVVLVLLVVAPPGWLFLAFVVPAALGAFRFGFRDAAEAEPEPLMVFPEPERPDQV